MFWKSSKKPKEGSNTSTQLVRQDSRTKVRTETAQSETKNTSVQNSTIFNDNAGTVTFQTTSQTVMRQQTARITVIESRRTATAEELEVMLRQMNMNKAESNRRSGGTFSNFGAKPSTTGISEMSMPKFKSTTKTTTTTPSRSLVAYDQANAYRGTAKPTNSASGAGAAKGTGKTLFKTQTTTVTQNDGRRVTSHTEQQRIKLNGTPFNLSSPNSPLTKNFNNNNNSTSSSSSYISPYRNPDIINNTKPLPLSNKPTSYATDARPFKSIYSYENNNKPLSVSSNASRNSSTSLPQITAPTRTSSSSSLPTSVSSGAIRKQKKPGYVYIFNNEKFDDPGNEYRVGSKEDVIELQKTFEQYGMKVKIYTNYTVEEIKSAVRKISKEDFSKHACLLIVLLSHGTRNEIICAKNGTYSINDDVLFPILANRTLDEKPKIFFVQACKGPMETNVFLKDAQRAVGTANEVLKCYSTFEGFVAYRSEKGSLFIGTLCEYIRLFGKYKDIKVIMEDVTRIVKDKSQGRQIPSITSTLTMPFKFGDYI